jgi:mRNA interferase MazF
VALTFHPVAGAVLVCDYRGFIEPEMVKRRLVVVISPRLRHRDGLCTVVPLSTTAPPRQEDYHHVLEFERPLPKPWETARVWVKADMVATVGFHRLDLIRIGKDQEGKRKYLQTAISDDDLQAIRRCVLHTLGLAALTPHL